MNLSVIQHSLLAALATLFFTFVMSLPGICAMAVASPGTDGDFSCTCLGSSGDSEVDDEHSCSCGCDIMSDGHDSPEVDPVLGGLASSQEELKVSSPTLWWTPKLVATLWVVDRLAGAPILSDPVLPPLAALPLWDRSDLYLENSILLI